MYDLCVCVPFDHLWLLFEPEFNFIKHENNSISLPTSTSSMVGVRSRIYHPWTWVAGHIICGHWLLPITTALHSNISRSIWSISLRLDFPGSSIPVWSWAGCAYTVPTDDEWCIISSYFNSPSILITMVPHSNIITSPLVLINRQPMTLLGSASFQGTQVSTPFFTYFSSGLKYDWSATTTI